MSSFAYQKPQRAVNFTCHAPEARSVCLVGDFNEWNPAANPMKQMPDRCWLITVEMKHGHHRYAFLVDDTIAVDPMAQGITRNEQGQKVSLVSVS